MNQSNSFVWKMCERQVVDAMGREVNKSSPVEDERRDAVARVTSKVWTFRNKQVNCGDQGRGIRVKGRGIWSSRKKAQVLRMRKDTVCLGSGGRKFLSRFVQVEFGKQGIARELGEGDF